MVVPGICLCLPEGTLITTDHGVKKIENLRPSDRVQTLSKKGVKKWTTFYTWGHRESDRVEEFVVLKVDNGGNELIISSEHLVFLAPENGTGGRMSKKAGQVCIGEKLISCDKDGAIQSCAVTDISVKKLSGLYSPFTMSGHFLANGFLVGCYANISDFEMAHAALAPLRLWYKTHSGDKNLDNEGIHGYARTLMKIRDILPYHLQQKLN